LVAPVSMFVFHQCFACSADIQNNIVAETGEFVVGLSSLELYLYLADRWPVPLLSQLLLKGRKVARRNQQFILLEHLLSDLLAQLAGQQRMRGPAQLDRGVESLLQQQIAYIPHKKHAPWSD